MRAPYTVTSLPAVDVLDATTRAWMDAVRMGFHQTALDDKSAQLWFETTKQDALRMRGIYTQTPALGLPDEYPVATFSSLNQTVNTGNGRLEPINMITDVTVRPTHRRKGLLRTMMTVDLDEANKRGHALAALTATEGSIYGRFGFGVATSEQDVEVTTSRQFQLRHEPGGTVEMAHPSAMEDVVANVFADFHSTHRGSHGRMNWYRGWLNGLWNWDKAAPERDLRGAVHLDDSGTADGYLIWQMNEEGQYLNVRDMVANTPDAELGLWQFIARNDLVEKARFKSFHPQSPLRWALVDPRVLNVRAHRDTTWLRILDPVQALSVRGFDHYGSSVLQVEDPLDHASGSYRLEVTPDDVQVTQTDEPAEVTIDVEALGSAYFGLAPISALAASGRVRGSADSVTRLDRLMRTDLLPHNLNHF